MKRRKGHEVDYAGKKYVSLHELCDDLDLPYSPLAHKYYRTKDIEQSVERAKKVKDAQTYIVWGREYKSLTDIAKEYGTSAAVISKRLQDGKTAEEDGIYFCIISDGPEKENSVIPTACRA